MRPVLQTAAFFFFLEFIIIALGDGQDGRPERGRSVAAAPEALQEHGARGQGRLHPGTGGQGDQDALEGQRGRAGVLLGEGARGRTHNTHERKSARSFGVTYYFYRCMEKACSF